MSRLEFWSEDRRFGLAIADKEWLQIMRICSRASTKETGGILVGLYTEALNCAMVTALSDAPPDSRIGRHWFDRGVAGLQRWLDKLWFKKRQYYLGEWHLHPNGLPNPSQTDIDQMKAIATTSEYRCPEPILLIVGGNALSGWSLKGFVFSKGEEFTELRRT